MSRRCAGILEDGDRCDFEATHNPVMMHCGLHYEDPMSKLSHLYGTADMDGPSMLISDAE